MDIDPLAVALERDATGWIREHLTTDIVAWLTTVAPDGRVQTSVICFMWDGPTLYFFSEPNTPKLRNIAHGPQVAFHLQSDEYGDHALIIEGRAVVDPTLKPSDEDDRYSAKYREPFVHWGMDEAETARTFSVPVRIHPTRVRII